MNKESSRVQCQNPTYIVEFFGIKVLFDLNLYWPINLKTSTVVSFCMTEIDVFNTAAQSAAVDDKWWTDWWMDRQINGRIEELLSLATTLTITPTLTELGTAQPQLVLLFWYCSWLSHMYIWIWTKRTQPQNGTAKMKTFSKIETTSRVKVTSKWTLQKKIKQTKRLRLSQK